MKRLWHASLPFLLAGGRPAAFLQSPGLVHETRSSFHFTVNGRAVRFGDVRTWQAR